MRDGASGADGFTPVAEYYAAIGVYYSAFFSVLFFGSEGFGVAELYAFAAGGAFSGVDLGVPWDLVAGDSLVVCFCHVFFTHLQYL